MSQDPVTLTCENCDEPYNPEDSDAKSFVRFCSVDCEDEHALDEGDEL